MSDQDAQPDQPEGPGGAPQAPAPPDQPSFAEGSFNPSELAAELQPGYRQMQAAYTRKTQDLAQQREELGTRAQFWDALEDDETRGDALAWLVSQYGPEAVLDAAGYEVDDAEPYEEFAEDDQPQQPDPRVDEVLQWAASREEQEAQEEMLDEIEEFADNERTRLGLDGETNDDVWELVLGRAAVYDLDDSDRPQIEQAAQDVQALIERQRENWLRTKRAPRSPINGGPGHEKPDLRDDDSRQEHMAWLMENAE